MLAGAHVFTVCICECVDVYGRGGTIEDNRVKESIVTIPDTKSINGCCLCHQAKGKTFYIGREKTGA